MKKVLLCSLSNAPRDADYLMEGATESRKPVPANQAPLALVQMVPEDKLPEEILVLCTKDLANNQFTPFCDNLAGVWPKGRTGKPLPQINKIEIPDGLNSTELWEIINCILDKVPQQCDLTLDITHGYRSFPFLYFVAALYLQILKGVKIQAVYYAMLDVKIDTKPVVDLSLILEMVEWFYAARFFRESGQAHHLAGLLKRFEDPPPGIEGPARSPFNQIKRLREKIEDFSRFYCLGLPFELGREAALLEGFLKANVFDVIRDRVPMLDELKSQIEEFIRPFALSPQNAKKALKQKLELTEQELQRQASLIDAYFSQGYLPLALGLIREWMISCIIYHNSNTDILKGEAWIYKNQKRAEVEEWLGSQTHRIKEKRAGECYEASLLPNQRMIEQWQYFSDTRNKLMHFGHQQDNVNLNSPKIEQLRERWQELKSSLSDASKWRIEKPARENTWQKYVVDMSMLPGRGIEKPGGEKILLISPLGMSPGLLFSAISHLRDRLWKVWVISSAQAVQALEEIKAHSGFSGCVDVVQVDDPFTCFQEGDNFYCSVRSDALQADKVVVNLTGGTTALQFVIQEAADRLKGEDLTVERIALIDRRPMEEQKKDPYQVGEIINLDRIED